MARLSANTVVARAITSWTAGALVVALASLAIGHVLGLYRLPLEIWFMLGLLTLNSVTWWLYTRRFADSVEEAGDALRVRRRGLEELIPISDIAKVSEQIEWRTRKVVLSLRSSTKFGRRIEFFPKPNSPFGSPGGSDVSRALRERVAMTAALGSIASAGARSPSG
ncbi:MULTISPECIES: hypothetical protein [unclassified Lysobacter]|uniref:hypothetical protein n=1 Tax=unclassified Lysobacter TaxID=2635362 RepID=UPI000701B263|nr:MULTISPECIES: hypothetical protein [unclassified Lysobacter]KRA21199.1 hypothetical protein ASD69_07980 [Lysobacter sp. Root604]KRD80228.1 hypothetical protein ASE43_05000 [Lysobacter sp. Root983]